MLDNILFYATFTFIQVGNKRSPSKFLRSRTIQIIFAFTVCPLSVGTINVIIFYSMLIVAINFFAHLINKYFSLIL